MSEYWKSTPTYWCKFCTQYVKDTPLEKKNHEASGRHQNNIQRSLRELHKRNDRETRDSERAKAEVQRLNGVVAGGKKSGGGVDVRIEGLKDLGGGAKGATKALATGMSAQQQRRIHAEQLLALGVQLPDELKKEVTGVGGWEAVSERVVEEQYEPERSMGDIVKAEEEIKRDVKVEMPLNRGVHKRRAEEDEVEGERLRKKAWGSRLRTYPGSEQEDSGDDDLEALLHGVSATKHRRADDNASPNLAESEPAEQLTSDDRTDDHTTEESTTMVNNVESEAPPVKQEDSAEQIDAPPVVFFKKRKAKG